MQPHIPDSRPPTRDRKGFTLVELMVALLLLDVALLALVATSALSARQLSEARLRSRATAAASNRVESIAARPCIGASGEAGTATVERGVREWWTVSAPVRGVRTVHDTVEISTASAPIRYALVTKIPC